MSRHRQVIAEAAAGRRSASQHLAEALAALLRPARLDGGLDLRGIGEPMHVCRRDDGTERCEVFYLRVSEPARAPPKPLRGVRVGGGFVVPHPSALAVEDQEKSVGDEELTSNPYHFGTYTRGEVRTSIGDRRHDGRRRQYSSSLGPPPRGDASFRVYSAERRSAGPMEDDVDRARAEAGHALDGVLESLGIQPSEIMGLGPQVHYESVVGGRWSVEVCYVCADHAPREVLAGLREEVARLRSELGHWRDRALVAERTRPDTDEGVQTEQWCPRCCPHDDGALRCPWCPAAVDFGTQASGCAHCGGLGHIAVDCPILAMPWCTYCGTRGHDDSVCATKPRLVPEGVQTDPSCGLCLGLGHDAPDCPWRAIEAKPVQYRAGGGFVRGPDAPDLSQRELDEAEARRALAAARAAGYLRPDGSVTYDAPRGARPSSAPARRRGDAKEAWVLARERGPPRNVAGDQERDALRKQLHSGAARCPSSGPGAGFLVGTYVRGRQDRHHRCASERAFRAPFRVYRSRITRDAACPSGREPCERARAAEGQRGQQAAEGHRCQKDMAAFFAPPCDQAAEPQAAWPGQRPQGQRPAAATSAAAGRATEPHAVWGEARGAEDWGGDPAAPATAAQEPTTAAPGWCREEAEAPWIAPCAPTSPHPLQLRSRAPSFYQELAAASPWSRAGILAAARPPASGGW